MDLNEISLRTHKGEYSPGETVYGVVYVLIYSPCPCTGVKLTFKGHEECSWDAVYPVEKDGKLQEEVTQRTLDPKTHFKAAITIAEFPGGIPLGQFCFPFQYPLQSGLPGSFELGHEGLPGTNWEASIRYTVEAELDMPGVDCTLSASQPIILYNDAPGRDVETLEYQEKSTVKMCCCIPKGDVMVRACLDKKSQQSGGEGIIHVHTHNDSSVDVDYFTITMNQVIILGDIKAGDASKCKFVTNSVLRQKYDGCPKGRSLQSDAVIKLEMEDGSPLQPSVEGCLIKCRYFTDIDVQVKWAPSISIQPIVHILAPKNKEWSTWEPPPWSRDCQLYAGSRWSPCVVPQNVLSSKIFASIPGFEPPL